MKRTKLLALTLVVAIMMMGAGYAYWQETLLINAEVNTGDLKVVFSEPADAEPEDKYQPNADLSIDDNENPNSMTVTYNKVYPGVVSPISFYLENEGTLGAYVDDFTFSNPSNINMIDRILCKSVTVAGHPKTYTGETLRDAMDYLNSLRGGNGIFVDTTLNEEDVDGINYTGERVLVTLDLEFDPDANETNFPQNSFFSFDINANVHQYNDLRPETPTTLK